MTAAMKTSLAGVITENEVIDITFIGPDSAVVSCLKTITDLNGPEALDNLPKTASLTYLMIRVDGEWRIALAQTTPIL